jgi:hypothetical protein
VPYVRVARTGDPAPGEPWNTYYSALPIGIDETGNVAVSGSVDGPGIDGRNNERIWWGSPFAQRAVFVEGPAPQYGDDAVFDTISGDRLSRTNQLAFTVGLRGDGGAGGYKLLLAGNPGNLQLTLRRDTVPPGITDGLKLGSMFPAVGPTDSLAVSGILYRDGSSAAVATGLWAGHPGNVSLVARSGTPAPGTAVDFLDNPSFSPNLTVNRRGAIAFPALLEGNGVDSTNNAGIWAGTSSDLSLVTRAGDPAPGTGPGVNFIGQPAYALINANDRVLFPAHLVGPGTNGSNNYGLWMSRPGQAAELVARNGDPVPVLGDAYTIRDVFPFFSTDADRVALVEKFTGPGVNLDNDQAIFFGGIDDLKIVFREGEQAPGLPPGVLLDFDAGTPHMAFVDSGAAALVLSLTGQGVDETNDRALFWRRTGDAPWAMVAREGDVFDGQIVRDGGIYLRVGSGASGGSQLLNEQGDLAFQIWFVDTPAGRSFGVYHCSRRARMVPVASPIRLRTGE